MSGLKKHNPSLRFNSGVRISPDEIDRYDYYSVHNPAVSPTYLGTCVGTQGQSIAVGFTNTALDYPRNIVIGLAGSAGLGGTATINGLNQFGGSISESFVVGTAANGGTKAGTLVFAKVTSGTVNFATTSEAGSGSARVGVAIGTGANDAHLFGLPTKIAGSTDIKTITWINNGTPTALNGGTIGAYVNTNQHGFVGTQTIALTDRFVVCFKSTYDASSEGLLANL